MPSAHFQLGSALARLNLGSGSVFGSAQFLARLSFGSGGGHSAHTAAQTTQYSSPDCELRAHPRDYDVGGAESGWVVWRYKAISCHLQQHNSEIITLVTISSKAWLMPSIVRALHSINNAPCALANAWASSHVI